MSIALLINSREQRRSRNAQHYTHVARLIHPLNLTLKTKAESTDVSSAHSVNCP